MWPQLGSVPTYGVFYMLGMLIHAFMAFFFARRLRLPHRFWIALSLTYVFAMTVGAKALFDFQHGRFIPSALLSWEHYQQGGMWGGPLAYLFLAVPVSLLMARDRLAALDVAALTLPIPLVLSKIACLCNGCCYGSPCSWMWAITFPPGCGAPGGVPIHPTQVYEIIVLLIVFAVLLGLNGKVWRGRLLPWFLVLYGVGRALTELWRADMQERGQFGPLSYSQWICLLGAAGAAGTLWLMGRSRSDDGPRSAVPPACPVAGAAPSTPTSSPAAGG